MTARHREQHLWAALRPLSKRRTRRYVLTVKNRPRHRISNPLGAIMTNSAMLSPAKRHCCESTHLFERLLRFLTSEKNGQQPFPTCNDCCCEVTICPPFFQNFLVSVRPEGDVQPLRTDPTLDLCQKKEFSDTVRHSPQCRNLCFLSTSGVRI